MCVCVCVLCDVLCFRWVVCVCAHVRARVCVRVCCVSVLVVCLRGWDVLLGRGSAMTLGAMVLKYFWCLGHLAAYVGGPGGTCGTYGTLSHYSWLVDWFVGSLVRCFID